MLQLLLIFLEHRKIEPIPLINRTLHIVILDEWSVRTGCIKIDRNETARGGNMVADMGAIGFLRKLDLTRRRFADLNCLQILPSP